jgi:RecB family endonuclease NucS
MRILVTRCSIRYEGRLVTTLESGDRVVLFKDDGSVVVHAVQGAKPINYMPGPTVVTEEGRTLRVSRPATGESLVIDVEDVHADTNWELEDAAKLVREGREKDIQATIFESPEAIEVGMVGLQRELFTEVGPVDLFCRDADGRTCVIEVKRVRAVAAAVEQLNRYMDEVQKNPAHAPCRGILVAPEIAPQARVLLEKWGYDFIARGEELMRLF